MSESRSYNPVSSAVWQMRKQTQKISQLVSKESWKPGLLVCAVSFHMCLGKLEPPYEKQDLWHSRDLWRKRVPCSQLLLAFLLSLPRYIGLFAGSGKLLGVCRKGDRNSDLSLSSLSCCLHLGTQPLFQKWKPVSKCIHVALRK